MLQRVYFIVASHDFAEVKVWPVYNSTCVTYWIYEQMFFFNAFLYSNLCIQSSYLKMFLYGSRSLQAGNLQQCFMQCYFVKPGCKKKLKQILWFVAYFQKHESVFNFPAYSFCMFMVSYFQFCSQIFFEDRGLNICIIIYPHVVVYGLNRNCQQFALVQEVQKICSLIYVRF